MSAPLGIDSDKRMDREELERMLGDFEAELTAAGLKTTAVFSYFDYARRFIRWIANDYRPRNAPPRPQRPFKRSWTVDELSAELDAYEYELQAARLKPNAIQTYLHGAGVFVRWLAGEYHPSHRAPAGHSGMRPNDIALELGVPGMHIRNYLRARFPRTESEKYSSW